MYQYKLTFELEQNWLPKETDRLIISFLKASAQAYSQEFYEKLYDKSKSVIKSYTYSCYLPGAKFLQKKIELESDTFSLFFSDADPQELLSFFNSFQLMKRKKYPMNGNSMTLVSIHMQQLPEIKEKEIVIRMQSPLIVRKHCSEDNTDVYYTCEMEGFGKALKENVIIFLDRLGMDAEAEDFSIQTIKGKKVVVPVFGRNTDASLGIFKLTGSCRLLNILYQAGLGVRRSEGHGKFEVIG
ncbi:MAG: CRISPR-associated endoribonuclease Cas6 [Lachnospiraceae bacterium]|nr:CRISPR-associated endoribonuclease Cas6 [Lachnospiraceae bacterium]